MKTNCRLLSMISCILLSTVSMFLMWSLGSCRSYMQLTGVTVEASKLLLLMLRIFANMTMERRRHLPLKSQPAPNLQIVQVLPCGVRVKNVSATKYNQAVTELPRRSKEPAASDPGPPTKHNQAILNSLELPSQLKKTIAAMPVEAVRMPLKKKHEKGGPKVRKVLTHHGGLKKQSAPLMVEMRKARPTSPWETPKTVRMRSSRQRRR